MNNQNEHKDLKDAIIPAIAVAMIGGRAIQSGNALQIVRDIEDITKNNWKKFGTGAAKAYRKSVPGRPTEKFVSRIAEGMLRKGDDGVQLSRYTKGGSEKNKMRFMKNNYDAPAAGEMLDSKPLSKLIGAVSTGAAFGAGTLGVDLLADSYFEKKKNARKQNLINNGRHEDVINNAAVKTAKQLRKLVPTVTSLEDIMAEHEKTADINPNFFTDAAEEVSDKFNAKGYRKKLGRAGVLQPAIRALAYTVPTAALSSVLKKDIHNNFEPIGANENTLSFEIDPDTFRKKDLKVVSDVISDQIKNDTLSTPEIVPPKEPLPEKTAKFSKSQAIKDINRGLYTVPWPSFFATDVPVAALSGATTAAVLSATSKLSGKNVKGTMEPLNSSEGKNYTLTLRKKNTGSGADQMNLMTGGK